MEGKMDPPALKVIVEQKAYKLILPSGIPETVEELTTAVKDLIKCTLDFDLQYLDSDFQDYFSLTGTDLLKHKDTIKVVYPMVTLNLDTVNLENVSFHSLVPQSSNEQSSSTMSQSTVESGSSASEDTIVLSPRSSPERAPWPKEFPIPIFTYETEIVLERANEAYRKDGTLLTSPNVKPAILDRLSQSIFTYTAYPTSLQVASVAEALVKKHPCLKDAASFTGFYSWQYSIKYKMGNFRSKLRNIGVPEVTCNSLKRKHPGDRKPAKNIKKAKKAEVNYLPPYPTDETEDSMEEERRQLLTETKKKNNARVIKEKMARTFAHRRHEVVNLCPKVVDFKDRWPGLFETSEINEEFQRLTTKPLEPKFMSMLDQYTPKLLGLFQSKGGLVGERLQAKMSVLLKDPISTIWHKREVVLRCLVEYLGENGTDLIKDYHDAADMQDSAQDVMKIYVIRKEGASEGDSPEDVGIILEGAVVIHGLGNVARAAATLLGLVYSLNLSYPKQLKYTFEAFQKLFIQLDDFKLSGKLQTLKNKLV